VDARRNARTARFPIASPSPGGTPARRDVNRQPLPRRNARTARCQSPAPPPAERPCGAMSIASPSPSGTPVRRDVNRQPRSGRGSVHEGGRPAERPHGAISNRQPLPRRNARAARCQSPAPPLAERPRGAMSIASPAADGAASTKVDARRNARTARFPIASPSPGGTPARRDFQSPAPQRTGQRPRRWTPGGTPARRDFQSPAPPPAERPRGAMSIASPAADGAASTKVDARRNARTARFPIASPSPGGTPARRDFQSPAPPPAERPRGAISNRQPLPRRNARAARFPIASPAAGQGSVHEGGRPAERPHGAISNRQPLPRRNARAARCQSPAPQRTGQRPRRWTPGGTPARRDFQSPAPPPAERPHGAISNRQPLPRRNARAARFPIASPSPGGTPARRDFQSPAPPRRNARAARCQSPAPQRTGQRPRRWTPGGTPARRDVNRQPLPRRNARAARCQSPAPPLAERPRGAMSIASPAADGAASTKVDARRHARTARCQSPAPPPAERPHGAMSIASPAADGAASTRVDARRNARAARFPIASPSPGGTPARRDVNRQPRSGRGSVHEGGRPAERPARRDFQSPAPLPSHPPTTARRSGRSSVG
jgi:hypothetical protein